MYTNQPEKNIHNNIFRVEYLTVVREKQTTYQEHISN